MLQDIVDYVRRDDVGAEREHENALYHLTSALADGFSALAVPGIASLLGPGARGATLAHGARVPGTSLELNPPMAAFNIGALLACADLAAILAVADYLARRAHNDGRTPLRVADVLTAFIKAQALAGMLADSPQPSTATLAATTAVVAQMLGGDARHIAAAVEVAWRHEAPRGHALGLAASRRAAAAAGCAVHWAWAAVHHDEPAPSPTPVSRPRCADSASVSAPRCDDGNGGLQRKFAASVAAHFAPAQAELILGRFAARATLKATRVNEFMASLVKNG
jgi:2-methylcitrate dehydratase PrpD